MKTMRRSICLLLALQMLCAPLAQGAQALPPAPPQPKQAAAPKADPAYYERALGGYGYRPFAYDAVATPDDANFRYRVENLPARRMGVDGTWGTDKTLNGVTSTVPGQPDFKTPMEMRVPDHSFYGWCVYTGDETDTDLFLDAGGHEPKFFTENGLATAVTRGAADHLISAAYQSSDIYKNTIPLVAHWALSNHATLRPSVQYRTVDGNDAVSGDRTATTALYAVKGNSATAEAVPLSLYKDDISAVAAADLGTHETAFAADTLNYYLRVPAETEFIELDLVAFEPYTYEGITGKTDVPKNVQVALGGTVYSPTYTPLNGSKSTTSTGEHGETLITWNTAAQNDDAHPASSLWTLRGADSRIPLKPGAAYNDVAVTVTAPGGVAQCYTFHIQRLTEPLLTPNPGNTPAGMIARDNALTADAKKTMLEQFKTDGRKFTPKNKPGGTMNNDGVIYDGVYSAAAWKKGIDPDLDPAAIVAYQNMSFTDPGFALTDSGGAAVTDLTANAKVSLSLRLVDKLTPGEATDGAGTVTELAAQIPAAAGGKNTYDLKDKNLVPGVYALEYRFTDPLSGKTYTSDTNTFYEKNQAQAAAFSRTLVLLPPPGDLTMDGVVTGADALVMEKALAAPGGSFPAASDQSAALYRARVCDVSRDGVTDSTDAEALWAGYYPKRQNGFARSDYFYLPLCAAPARSTQPLEPSPVAAGDKANLSLEYLGTTVPKKAADYTPEERKVLDATLADGTLLSTPKTMTADSEGAAPTTKDVLWVGARLTNVGALPTTSPLKQNPIYTMSLSFLYDAAVVTPAGGSTEEWLELVKLYNIRSKEGAGDAGVPTNSMWGADYSFTPATGPAAPDLTDPGKEPMPLEAAAGKNLKQINLTVRWNGTGTSRVLGEDVMVFRLPFRLVKQLETTEKLAFDLSLGMAETSVCGNTGAAQDAAWGPAFGGVGQDLRGQMQYTEGTGRIVKRGIDSTTYAPLKNETAQNAPTVYGEPFLSRTGNTAGMTQPNQKLLTDGGFAYDQATGTITGTPNNTQPVKFYVGTTGYQIIPQKAPLTLTPKGERAYYGENMPALTFTYDTAQIKELDKTNPAFDWASGKGSELAHLGGYISQPDELPVTALTSEGKPVAAGTPVGEYYITLSGGENSHYAYCYTAGSELSPTRGYAALSVLKRPVFIEKFNRTTPLHSIYFDSSTLQFEEQNVGVTDPETPFTVAPGVSTGSYNGLPLGNKGMYGADNLIVSYRSEFVLDAQKGDVPGNLKLSAPTEKRDIKISNLTLTADPCNSNYELVYPGLKSNLISDGGTVLDRAATAIEIISGVDLTYNTGTPLSLQGLTVKITYGTGAAAPVRYVQYNGRDSFLTENLTVSWEDAATSNCSQSPSHSLIGPNDSSPVELKYTVHNGKYIRIALAVMGENGTKTYINAHLGPMTILKKLMTLRADELGRYYGEADPELTFRYDPTQLTDTDRAKIKAETGKEPTGAGEELKRISGSYTAPTLKTQTGRELSQSGGKSLPLKPNDPVGTDCYFTVISGAASDSYTFRYERITDVPNLVHGYKYFKVEPRPIVVQKITAATDALDSKTEFIYDDTASLRLETMTYPDAPKTRKPTAASSASVVDHFTASLPAKKSYYPAGGSGVAEPLKYPLAAGDAIYKGDALTLTYLAQYQGDHAQAPYFTFTTDKATERRPMTTYQMDLVADEKNTQNNYVLVYDATLPALNRTPADNAALGTVKLRPMQSIGVNLDPVRFRSKYTYGDPLALEGMSLTIHYETAGDNYPNAPVKTVDFYRIWENGAVKSDSFRALGLNATWAPKDDKETLASGKWSAQVGTYPTPAEHSGRQIIISGKRHKDHADTRGQTQAAGGITISKKDLPLTVAPQYRYYGEKNSDYAFTFQKSDLALPDGQVVNAMDLTGGAGTTEGVESLAATSAALSKLKPTDPERAKYYKGYQGPKFTTTARQGSDVGVYDLTLAGGTMDNYSFSYTPATIRLFRRPIVVNKITTTADVPVYTIYYNTEQTAFDTSVTAGQFTATTPGANGAFANSGDPDYQAAMQGKALPLGSTALYAPDQSAQKRLGLRLTAVFPSVATRTAIPEGKTSVAEQVQIRNMALTDGAENYMLVYKSDEDGNLRRPLGDAKATAKLDKRNIKSVRINTNTSPKTAYTYGETLDLSNLMVDITYEGIDGGTETVRADAHGSIYISYWDPMRDGSLPNVANQAACAAVVNEHRAAKTGDHVTIAPVHDDPDAAWKNTGSMHHMNFAANGKQLVASAKLPDKALGWVQPVMVTGAGGAALQIAVAPLALTYGLRASEKTYDGDRKAVGTLTLNNVYRQGAVEDVVYIKTGASYELPSGTWDKYTDFRAHIAQNGYQFTTGTYDPATKKMTYTGGSYGSGTDKLTFTFTDPNVAYLTPPDHDSYGALAAMPVHVTGMDRLGGPDAGNYSIVSKAEGAAAPVAKILKADRLAPAVPLAENDVHTNAVRITMAAAPETHGPAWGDAFNSELHYEYAADYWPADAATGKGTPLPAENAYQDKQFFGGEPVKIDPPAGYEPDRVPDPPKEGDVIKGQIYRWSTADPEHAWNKADDDFGWNEAGTAVLRDPIPKNSLVRGRVRLAETHNFNASPDTPSVPDSDLAATAAQALSDAQGRAEAQIAAGIKGGMTGDKGKEPTQPDPAPLVKTYTQRLKVISTEEKTGKDSKRYTVSTLESLWFTDVLTYEKTGVMDAVVKNYDPTRYYGYFWDIDRSAQLKFDPDPLSLTDPIQVEIKEKGEDGKTEEKTVTVNENHQVDLHISTSSGGGDTPDRSISIQSEDLVAVVGDAPVTLTVKFKPSYATRRTLKWTSSDEKVATVSGRGMVSFVGPGTATITATSYYKHSDTIKVRVYAAKAGDSGAFNAKLTEPFMTLDQALLFHPNRTVDRAELVVTLARFYQDALGWTASGSGKFPDVTGTEPYAAAAKLLGEAGIVTGDRGGKFSADRPATRAEFITILVRMLGIPAPSTKGQPHAFSDSGEGSTWAYSYIDAAFKAGLTQGVGHGRFNPNGVLTRAELAGLLARALKLKLDVNAPNLKHPADVPTKHWGYEEILRAVNSVAGEK